MLVLSSLEDSEGVRCVDFFVRPDGTFGFRECRRDPEDGGRWTLVADYSDVVYKTKSDAMQGAAATIGWFRPSDID